MFKIEMNLKVIVLFFVIWGGSGCNFNQPPPATPTVIDLTVKLDTAIKQLEAKEYQNALANLDEAIKLKRDDPQPIIIKGQIYLEQHRWGLAQHSFENALVIENNSYKATIGLAKALLAQGKHTQSKQFWRKAIDLAEDKSEGWVGLGEAYLIDLDYEEAKQAFETALKNSPHPKAQWFLGVLLIPTNFEAGLAYLNAISNKKADQIYLLEAMESFDSRTPQAELATNCGIALIQLEAWELAHYALLIATDLNSDEAMAWAFLGYVKANLGLPAMSAFNKARKLEPTLALTPYFEGIYLRKKDLHDVAVDRFLEALDLDPGNLGFALEAAFTLEEKGDYLSAEALYQSIVSVEPESIEFQHFLVAFYINRNYKIYEKGLVEAERLVELAPTDARSFDLLGWGKYKVADFKGAEEALQQAITLDPNNMAARYHLGETLQALQRGTDAEEAFNYVINQDTSGVYREIILKTKE